MSFENKFRNLVRRSSNLSKDELVITLRLLLEELNRQKGIFFRDDFMENADEYQDEIWDEITKHIKKSRIKRYNWKKIIGESLTKRILRLRKKELTIEETIETINRLPGVIEFIKMFPEEDQNMAKNIKINVHARYGENKTSEKINEKN
jgi:hypothetical protein